jgi:hypothetical protein
MALAYRHARHDRRRTIGFEDPKFISEFVVLNPEDTDQRAQGAITMRSIKNAIVGTGTVDAGSFTPNATGQYTGTMTDIDRAIASLYDAPVTGDVLTYNGAEWESGPLVPAVQSALFNGYAGTGGADEIYFTNTDMADLNAGGIATITNTALGWRLTADVDLVLNVAWSVTGTNSSTDTSLTASTVGDIAGAPTTLAYVREFFSLDSYAKDYTVAPTVATTLAAGQTISMVLVQVTATVTDAYASVSVQAIA